MENGATTYYLRSSMLGNQVNAEIDEQGVRKRSYVYLGGQLLALLENNAVTWVHQDPITKSQRFTDSSGAVLGSKIDLDPWGAETTATVNPQIQSHRFTTYERDANGSDDAMHRRYNSVCGRFDQPDPFTSPITLLMSRAARHVIYANQIFRALIPAQIAETDYPRASPCSTSGQEKILVAMTTETIP